jgi:uncharacterized protein YbdZ (MbtH family)
MFNRNGVLGDGMTDNNDEDDNRFYKVVINHEDQYSIWPADRENPAGWRDAGKQGPKAQCLEYINEVWTDMRPLSLRNRQAEASYDESPPDLNPPQDEPTLVERLSEGTHAMEFCSRAEVSAAALKERIESGFIHVRFPETRGTTELGIKLDPQASDLSNADFERATGEVLLAGNLTLDGVRVKCLAKLDLSSLKGTGRLEILP